MATRRNSFGLEVDVRAVESLANGIARIDATRLGEAGMTAVNEVATRSEQKVRRDIAETINLSDTYLQERMSVRLADNPAAPEAVISAAFRHTNLGRYDPNVLMKPVRNRDRAKGDPARGIPKGMKAAGVSVEVVRGARKPIERGFVIPTSNGPIVATRNPGDPKYKTRLGPSVYQLARVQYDRLGDEIGIDLELTVLQETERVIEGVLR